jgi:hypothetical protein
MRTAPLLTAILLASSCAGSAPAVSTDATLRVSRVVLFQNGLAYVERRGETASSSIDIDTRIEHLDDVLKSLTVVDGTGGGVASVRVLPHDANATTVTLRVGLREAERHALRVSYVTEASGWRPTYRLVAMDGGRIRLQGLAVVDNRSSEAWQGIDLALSTEVPLSFRYALREPRTSNRPMFASDGTLLDVSHVALPPDTPSDVQMAYALLNAGQPDNSNRAGRLAGPEEDPAAAPGAQVPPAPGAAAPAPERVDAMRLIAESDTGGGFTIESRARFSLGDGESGLVPFVDEIVPGELVLLYKPATATGPSARRPYRAVLFENPLDAPLLPGPVAVYSGDSFAGDGVTATIPGGAHAFVAFATEPSVGIAAGEERVDDEVRGLTLTGGMLEVELRAVVRRSYEVTASRPWEQRVFAYAPALEGFEAREVPEGSVVTNEGWFVPVDAPASHAELTFDLVQRRTETVNIATDPRHMWVGPLLTMLEDRGGADVARLRQIANRLRDLDDERVRFEEDLAAERQALLERREALGALREVPTATALRQRLAAGVAEGVRRVDELTGEVVARNAESVALRQEWYARLRELTIA